VKRDVPEIAVKATPPAPYAVPAVMPPAPSVGSGAGSAAGSAPRTDETRTSTAPRGCGCDAGGGAGGIGFAGLAGLVALVCRRRRRA
jgi:MYXO-CTERM domain-containing protein